MVELQLRAAAGETLPLSQKDVQIRGHAIQVRVYPEDPETFLPQVGTVTELNLPRGNRSCPKWVQFEASLDPEYVRVDSQGNRVLLSFLNLFKIVIIMTKLGRGSDGSGNRARLGNTVPNTSRNMTPQGGQEAVEGAATRGLIVPSGIPCLPNLLRGVIVPIDRTKVAAPALDIVTIALCATICGADSWVDIELFGNCKEEWFKSFLELPNGIPSHDTFGGPPGPEQTLFHSPAWTQSSFHGFMEWVQAVAQVTQGEVVAIDGKTVRRSHDRTLGKKAIHMVNVWASSHGLALGQTKVGRRRPTHEIHRHPQVAAHRSWSEQVATAAGARRLHHHHGRHGLPEGDSPGDH